MVAALPFNYGEKRVYRVEILGKLSRHAYKQGGERCVLKHSMISLFPDAPHSVDDNVIELPSVALGEEGLLPFQPLS